MKRLDCKDFGTECDYATCAPTEEEVLQKVGEHIQAIPAMKGFSKEFYQKSVASIHEGRCEEEMSRDELLCEVCSGVCWCETDRMSYGLMSRKRHFIFFF